MHHVNNAVIMQTKQLGRIETLEEKLLALEGCNQQLEQKLEEQDHIIANLMGDNLEHLQDNMLNGGSAYARTYVNRLPLTSEPMPEALLSDPMIRIPLS